MLRKCHHCKDRDELPTVLNIHEILEEVLIYILEEIYQIMFLKAVMRVKHSKYEASIKSKNGKKKRKQYLALWKRDFKNIIVNQLDKTEFMKSLTFDDCLEISIPTKASFSCSTCDLTWSSAKAMITFVLSMNDTELEISLEEHTQKCHHCKDHDELPTVLNIHEILEELLICTFEEIYQITFLKAVMSVKHSKYEASIKSKNGKKKRKQYLALWKRDFKNIIVNQLDKTEFMKSLTFNDCFEISIPTKASFSCSTCDLTWSSAKAMITFVVSMNDTELEISLEEHTQKCHHCKDHDELPTVLKYS